MTERFLRKREVAHVTGLPISSLYDLMAKGMFPRPVNLGPRAVAWRESEVANWQKGRIAARDGEPATA